MNRIRSNRSHGFTLLELIIAMSMLTALVIMMIIVLRSSVASYGSLTLQSQVQHDNRISLDMLRNALTPAIAFSYVDTNDQLVDVFTVVEGEFDPSADANDNGMRDAGEAFEDSNGNALYDGPTDALLVTLATGVREDPFVDENGNDIYDPGEPFTDLDGDGTWTDMNGNGRYDPKFRTIAFPAELSGTPDPHSIQIFAPFNTPEGHRQLRLYTLYRNEFDIDGDGTIASTDTDGDGVVDSIEDGIEVTGLPWNPPYTFRAINEDVIMLVDKSGASISVGRDGGDVNGSPPYTPPSVICNRLRFLDFDVDVNVQQQVMVNIQLAMLANVESFNVNATGKGRVHSTLTTGIWLSN
jgi:type II secretory pathway pseudopilin PulG